MPASISLLRAAMVRDTVAMSASALFNAAWFAGLSRASMVLDVRSSLVCTVESTFSSQALSDGLVRVTGRRPCTRRQQRCIPAAAAQLHIGDARERLGLEHCHGVGLDRRSALDRKG